MTSTPATITIPRLDEETPRAYAARVEYLTMGAQRSIDKLAQNHGKITATFTRQAENWSVKYGWVQSARLYDQALAGVAVHRHRAEYDAALEAHRTKILDKTTSLTRLLDGLEAQVARAITGQVVEGKDGKTYYIPKMAIDVSALAALVRGRLTVADMEAHALDIPGLRAALMESADDA